MNRIIKSLRFMFIAEYWEFNQCRFHDFLIFSNTKLKYLAEVVICFVEKKMIKKRFNYNMFNAAFSR